MRSRIRVFLGVDAPNASVRCELSLCGYQKPRTGSRFGYLNTARVSLNVDGVDRMNNIANSAAWLTCAGLSKQPSQL